MSTKGTKAPRHGLVSTRVYKIYENMMNRCRNPNADNYQYYGGRGITVCGEWLGRPVEFYAWAITNGYQPGLTLDRINGDEGYCPGNCRWATLSEQMNNTRNNRLITVAGETHTMMEWARIKNVPYKTLAQRVYRGSEGEDLFVPLGEGRRGRKPWNYGLKKIMD